MTREEILKNQIIAKYGSVAKFAKAADISDSTIRNIFSRGLDGVGVGIVVKICNHLNLDVESLVSGSFQTRPNPQKEAIWKDYAQKNNLINGDEELTAYLEVLKTRPELRMLFQVSKDATKEDVEQAVKIIEILRNP